MALEVLPGSLSSWTKFMRTERELSRRNLAGSPTEHFPTLLLRKQQRVPFSQLTLPVLSATPPPLLLRLAQRWAAQSFKNKSLVLDKTTTSTGSTGMNLVLRPGALKDGEGYTFTLHITDLATGEEGYASIDLLPNQPPFGGTCQLSPVGPVPALTAKIHVACTGRKPCAGDPQRWLQVCT